MKRAGKALERDRALNEAMVSHQGTLRSVISKRLRNQADVEDVLQDVLAGFVSVQAAGLEYGVVITGEAVDPTATAALRDRRPPTRAFHRHDYVDAMA